MLNKFTEIAWRDYHFVITDSPNSVSQHDYVSKLQRLNVTRFVRTCELTYDEEIFKDGGITTYVKPMQDMHFPDGAFPPRSVLAKWFFLVQEVCNVEKSCVAVHCMAGLGRAPLLVALSLIEAGCDYLDAVRLVRERRPGAINAHQIDILRRYRRKNSMKQKACCQVM